MDAIVGTAGHIDHGKTALVKALTGVDADRLPEEKQRGITIDLGFAEMMAGDTHFGFVDVPGHERFVRNMLAGASGIDIVLLVVAADEGVMPQTREHFDICRLLDIKTGVIALTKSDLVDAETLEMARMDVAELVARSFLQNADVVPVSSRTRSGIEDLRTALAKAAKGIGGRSDNLVARLPIDRSFTVKGFGTVVTGTLVSGQIGGTSTLELLPSRVPVRIRGIQTHGSSTDIARTGQRTAVNLASVDHSEIERGMTLVESGTLRPAQILDADVEVLKNAPRPLRSRQRVRVHIGTAELLGRIQVLNETGEATPGTSAFIQIRLESPAASVAGERFIIRSYSPQMTIAGGAVLDPLAERHRRRDREQVTRFLTDLKLALDDPRALVAAFVGKAGNAGATVDDLVAATGFRRDVVEDALSSDNIFQASGRYLTTEKFDAIAADSKRAIESFHASDKLAAGMPREVLRNRVFAHLPEEVFDAVVNGLARTGDVRLTNDILTLASHRNELSAEEQRFRHSITAALVESKLMVPRIADVVSEAGSACGIAAAHAEKLLQAMIKTGEVIRVSDEFYFASPVIEELTRNLRTFADNSPDRLIDVTQFKEITGFSRKYAIPLLEHFDRIGVTRRAGDKRVITK